MARDQVHIRLSFLERRRLDRIKQTLGLPRMYDTEAIQAAIFWYWLSREKTARVADGGHSV
jgi:hypothetical protein